MGCWGAAWHGAAALLWPAPPALAAALSTLATVWITGCFHEDGLADTLDVSCSVGNQVNESFNQSFSCMQRTGIQ